MKVSAKRTKRVTVHRDIEILSSRLSTDSLDANGSGALWISLKRRCCVCRELFKHGDSVSLCLYLENGEQFSGGVHTECLPEEKLPSTDGSRTINANSQFYNE